MYGLLASALSLLFAQGASPEDSLTIDELFPTKSYFGKTASQKLWSPDDRYIAYLWNPYAEHGMDLWVYDTRDHKAQRLTSIETMMPFDRGLKEIAERYKKEKIENDRRDKLTDVERRKLEDEDAKKREDLKEKPKEYPGIPEFSWAHKSDELLFTYKGDVYRERLGDKVATRLSKTQQAARGVKYTADDKGFFFERGNAVYRLHFDSPFEEQLNPPLTDGLQMGDYNVSPDDSKIMIAASKETAPERQIDYMSYRDRFSKDMKAPRSVADDPFNFEQHMYLFDLNDESTNDGKPWEIFTAPAGHEWVQTSIDAHPWSADGKRFVFGVWKRDSKELTIQVADLEKKKNATVYKDTSTGEHESPGFARPFFTPDATKIVLQLDKSGYRQVWVVDPLTQGASQLTAGDFESWPEAISKDGKTLFVRASKEDLCREDLYRVDMATHEMTRLSSQQGTYRQPVISHDFGQIATEFQNFDRPVEAFVLDARHPGTERSVTDSHSPRWAKIQKLKPQMFVYKNREGQDVHGLLFLPPDYKKTDKRPLMIYTYGGALGEGREVWDGNTSGFVYGFPMYEAYTLGYVAVTIDPRGSSDYSNAFGNANYGHPGVAQVADLSDGVKYLIATYNVDPTKVGINGWSFGGFQTQMCMYTAPDVFTLGIAGAGPTEWQNYNNWYVGGTIGPNPLNDPKPLDKYSTTYLAKNLRNPLMLLHGMEDTNVLFQDTIHVYRELLKADKGPLVELVLDPTGSHGLGGDIKTRQRFEIYDGFLRRRWGVYKRP